MSSYDSNHPVPGSYPPATYPPAPQPTVQDARNEGQGTLNSSAADTAKQHLPPSGSSYPPTNKNELPSKEMSTTSRGGVGSLPGGCSETGVAKSPEERAQEGSPEGASTGEGPPSKRVTSTLPSKEAPGGSRGGVGSLPGNYSERSVAKLPEERREEALPSRETSHEQLGKTAGVGPMPGGPNESRVAVLPDERTKSEKERLGSGARESESKEKPEEGKEAGKEKEKSAERLGGGTKENESKEKPEEVKEKGKEKEKPKGATGRLDEDYHPAKLHPPDPSKLPPTVAPESPAAPHTTRSTSPETAAKGDTGEHKVGLKEKLKGQAKVISGKLEHDEKKIEEGKHMMGK